MNQLKAKHSLLDPRLFNNGRDGIKGEFIGPGVIKASHSEYYLMENQTFYTEETVFVFMNYAGSIFYETQSVRNENIRKNEENERRWKEERKKILEQREIDEAKRKEERGKQIIAFYQSYSVPFKFVPKIKIVLSGLTENSNGDGMKRNSVFHTYVLEDFVDGRLSRSANTYLCSPKDSGSFHDYEVIDTDEQIQGAKAISDITCSNCLKLMKRWKIEKDA